VTRPADSARWSRLEELFHAALEREPAQRGAYLRAECGADETLRARVERLIESHARSSAGFLEPPAVPPLEGRQLGEFRLVRLIGAGGMGAVYEAEQTHPRRRLALKVVRALPGAELDARRLSYEAEIMARLSHPNVAQIHAAGAIEDPAGTLVWFAMELVPGARTLVEHARDKALSLRERLELFDRVCLGVQHGHQRGVVHRDLKPDNVLVDAEGAPKVIDFGIARAAHGDESIQTALSSPRSIAGSLAYMAPEQARGDQGAVDTRSDVYALGVILYELLTERRPLDLRDKSLTQAIALIQSEPPQRPSVLRAELAGDLEAIILRALAKAPEERYATAGELAEDLRRFRAGMPVTARAPSFAHQVRLLARRHRAAAAAAGTIAVALAAAAAVSIVFGLRAQRSASDERAARLHAERVSGLLEGILTAAQPTTESGREVTARELVDEVAAQAERELAGDAAAQIRVLQSLGWAYFALGHHEQAEANGSRSLAIAEQSHDPRSAAVSRCILGAVAFARGRAQEAESLLEQALAFQRADPLSQGIPLGRTLYRLGELHRAQGDSEAAKALLGEALAAYRADPSLHGSNEPLVLIALGHVAYNERKWSEAEAFQREALALMEAQRPAGHLEIAKAQNSLAATLFDSERTDEALELWTRALETFERVLDPDHPDLAAVTGNLALAYQRKKDWPRAGELHRRALELRRAALGPTHEKVVHTLTQYANFLLESGDATGAEAAYGEAVESARASTSGVSPVIYRNALAQLALVQLRAGKHAEAEANLREVLEAQRAALEPRHPDLAQTLTMLGATLLAQGRAEEARASLAEALEIRRERFGDHWLVANTQSLYGEALCALERYDEAEPLLLQSVERLRATLGEQDFRARDAAGRVGRLYKAWGKPELAEPWIAAKE
jgi:eukaryotic-like serine/threonine-protein kinase